MPDSDASDMMPKPPSWMSARMTHWPKCVQYEPVSSTMSPVSDTAEVAVKNAGRNGVQCGTCAEMGNMSNSVPVKMRAINPTAVSRAGPSHEIFTSRS